MPVKLIFYLTVFSLLLLISSYDQYASSSFTSNNVMSVDKLQTVKITEGIVTLFFSNESHRA